MKGAFKRNASLGTVGAHPYFLQELHSHMLEIVQVV